MMQAEAETGAPNRLIDRLKAKPNILIVLGLAVVFVVVTYFLWRHFGHHKLINNVAAPTNSAIAEGQNNEAKKAIDQKNYKAAAQDYVVSASLAQSSKDYQKAKSILETAINKIPDDQTPYTIYDSLYSVAAAMNDKPLEISSLKKALAKAQQRDSGAPAGLTDFYNEQLKKLGQ